MTYPSSSRVLFLRWYGLRNKNKRLDLQKHVEVARARIKDSRPLHVRNVVEFETQPGGNGVESAVSQTRIVEAKAPRLQRRSIYESELQHDSNLHSQNLIDARFVSLCPRFVQEQRTFADLFPEEGK